MLVFPESDGPVTKKWPEPLRRFVPTIPSNRSGSRGEVQAIFGIRSFGYVTAIELERGIDRPIDDEIAAALYRWKFKPAMVGGVGRQPAAGRTAGGLELATTEDQYQ